MSRTPRSQHSFFMQLIVALVAMLELVLACGSHLAAQGLPDPIAPSDQQTAPEPRPDAERPAIRNTPAETKTPPGFPPLVEPTADPAAAERIQRALQGGTSEPVPGGVLGDVIDIIRTQGSILDGSSLDPRMVHPERGPRADNQISATEKPTSSVQAAEALLRSARLLESLSIPPVPAPEGQTDRLPTAELIRQMRIQATQLMLSEFPQAID